jgi:hypothetical protein
LRGSKGVGVTIESYGKGRIIIRRRNGAKTIITMN